MIDYLRAILKILFSKKQSRTYYSQFGEDVVLRELMGKRHPKGSYLDIGCYHPRKHSNTYFLYKLGWSGMLVDIEGKDYDAIKSIDFKRHSPKFILIECWNDFDIDKILQGKIHRKLTENNYELTSWTINTLIYRTK